MKLAIDVMSGDFSPENEINGALGYLEHSENTTVCLVGCGETIEVRLKAKNADRSRIDIVDVPTYVDMDGSPSAILRLGDKTSMGKAISLCASGNAAAVVSTGNTGAQLALSAHVLGKQEGVLRPCIGAYLPKAKRFSFLIDVGSLVDAKAKHLLQFAELATEFLRTLYTIKEPTIGLLNIGAEETKGNTLAKEAHALLSGSKLNFIGNIEGHHVLKNSVDIIVCDGFTGNVVLKMYEHIIPFIEGMPFHDKHPSEARQTFKSVLSDVTEVLDYQSYGGVPILGVHGVSIVCHGRSSAKAVESALHKAEKLASLGFGR